MSIEDRQAPLVLADLPGWSCVHVNYELVDGEIENSLQYIANRRIPAEILRRPTGINGGGERKRICCRRLHVLSKSQSQKSPDML